MNTLLKKGPDLLGKRKHSFSQHLSNFKASSKTLKRTQDQGHYVRRSDQSPNYNNKYSNHNWQHSSRKKDTYHQSSSWKLKKHCFPSKMHCRSKTLTSFKNTFRTELSHSRVELSSSTWNNGRNLHLIQTSWLQYLECILKQLKTFQPWNCISTLLAKRSRSLLLQKLKPY